MPNESMQISPSDNQPRRAPTQTSCETLEIDGASKSCDANADGECGRGTYVCVNDEPVCEPRLPTDEVCDGLDNGAMRIDESIDASCGDSSTGQCQLGSFACFDGEVGECEGVVNPEPGVRWP